MDNIIKIESTEKAGATVRQAANDLWLRVNQAREVAACISIRCEASNSSDALAKALAQVDALAGVINTLLSLALSDTEALESMVAKLEKKAA